MFWKILKKVLGAVVLFAGIYALYYHYFYKSEIKDTVNVVENVRKLNRLVTMHYLTDLVVIEKKDSEFSKSFVGRMIHSDSKEELVVIAKCDARAGFDLSKITSESISVYGDSVSLILPEIEIFDITCNPSEFEIFYEDGQWTHDQIGAVSEKAKSLALKEIKDNNLLQNAIESGITRLENILSALGFTKVSISVIQVTEQPTSH